MFKILYICTHNRCRSILSEAITNHIADSADAVESLVARSAGSQPAGQVHPLSIKFLAERGISTEDLVSQSWDELETFEPDLVVTVCDSAAGESCPVWFGRTLKVHWGLNDPSKLEGSEDEVRAAFLSCMDEIEHRVNHLSSLPLSTMSKGEQKQALLALGAV